MSSSIQHPYIDNPLHPRRLATIEVQIGSLKMGGGKPIVVQSMTTADTMDTEKSVQESIEMIEAGCQLVRLTAPSLKEAENLAEIKRILREKGYDTPLVADIHFTPNAAEIAADYVEKVRVNPGNYADKKKFEHIEYTAETYQSELKRIEDKFTPLVLKCKKLGRAMRIGTNHGSLSDRILSRYGDTPEGMVESAMEFVHICRKHDYHNLVISMKASNTIVMVQAYRLLVATMHQNNFYYPIHLGVTEAGDGEDGRIKSAVGIGALLIDGIGDTVRVSLTEDAVHEVPVAQKIIKATELLENPHITAHSFSYNPYSYQRRQTHSIGRIGAGQVPVVIGDLSKAESIKPAQLFAFGYQYQVQLDKWNISDLAVDFVYTGSHPIDFPLPGTLQQIVDYPIWKSHPNQDLIPIMTFEQLSENNSNIRKIVRIDQPNDNLVSHLVSDPNIILLCEYNESAPLQFRALRLWLDQHGLEHPVLFRFNSIDTESENYQITASAHLGHHFIDGFGDGIWIVNNNQPWQLTNQLSFGILQATRTRITKTEYISCPSCGRTLFDLQETTAKIRQRTHHLKGVKIGIMGCIVNGPGEMADADYGYVGTGPGKINLYKEKTVIKRNIPEQEAVEALVELIREHGDWVEPA